MKILLINDYGHPTGGAEIIVLGLRDELRRRGHDARLFASLADNSFYPNQADFSCYGTVGSFRTLLQCVNFSALTALKKILRDFRPDVVHVNLYLTQLSPLILPLLRDVPTVYYEQWYRAICPLGTKRLPGGKACTDVAGAACRRNGCLPLHDWLPLQMQRFLDQSGRSAFRRVAAISQAVADQLVRFGDWKTDEIEVIHAGTPLVAPREEMSPEPVFVFSGRLVPEKGADVVLRAFARMSADFPMARLRFIGDGPERGRLEKQAVELGIEAHVAFTGSLSNVETIAAMRDAWALCVPSLWEEPFGLVAVEAAMNGVAVIASACGGLSEIVRDGKTGWLVPSGKTEALADALREACRHPSETWRRGLAGHENARERFNMPTFASRWEKIYASIC